MQNKNDGRLLFRTIAGSHLYGIADENSDLDVKSVFLPDLAETFERVQKRKDSGGAWSAMGDVFEVVSPIRPESKKWTKPTRGKIIYNGRKADCENIPLQSFVRYAAENQTTAIEMLFAPEEFWLPENGEKFDFWREKILPLREKFISKSCVNFISYAKNQIKDYCGKGDRLNELKRIAQNLETSPKDEKIAEALKRRPQAFKGISYIEERGLVEACGIKMPVGARIKTLLALIYMRIGKYGRRSIGSAALGGRDLKALSHALRAVYEAEELADSRRIAFPLPRAEELKRIKSGKLSKKELGALPERIMAEAGRVKSKIMKSNLPQETGPFIANCLVGWVAASAYWKYLNTLRASEGYPAFTQENRDASWRIFWNDELSDKDAYRLSFEAYGLKAPAGDIKTADSLCGRKIELLKIGLTYLLDGVK